MTIVSRTFQTEEYRFGFNGMEKDTKINAQIYHAEFWKYDARTARRWNVDPKTNPSMSTYNAFAGNPIFYQDPLGDSVQIWFNKAENSLYLIDYDHYDKNLETRIVTYDQYIEAGARDESGKLLYNQKLVIRGDVISGGDLWPNGILNRDFTRNPNAKPTPNGHYDLLSNRKGKAYWFDLDYIDGDEDSPNRYNDEIDSDNPEIDGRFSIRLHMGMHSNGCVTYCLKTYRTKTNYYAKHKVTKEWALFTKIIENTSSKEIKAISYNWRNRQPWYSGKKHKLKRYGTVFVTGTDNMPTIEPLDYFKDFDPFFYGY